jgi:hypothetical protein
MRLRVSKRASIAVASALAIGGCMVADETGNAGDGLTVMNGSNMNGSNMNGSNMNGSNQNGSELGSVILWSYLGDAWLEGSELVVADDRRTRRGRHVIGATFTSVSNLDLDVTLRISDVAPPTAGSDVWHYWVDYLETDGAWYPICSDGDQSLSAIPLGGWWDRQAGVDGGGSKVDDPDKFTFACVVVGALGKCVEAGYRPWAEASGVSLDDHHQACVRLMRKDYCGDGTSHTIDGRLVNLYDAVGVQDDTESWVFEGEWDPDGAICLAPGHHGPGLGQCRATRLRRNCGALDHFATGALLMSERPRRATGSAITPPGPPEATP